tara:strand:+ start:16173 stop:16562 length:390 start_codon:yes stop_codon:yes gene_type:complete
MVQALVVVFEDGLAFCFAAVVFGVGVGDVAGEDFLPEGEAARGACGVGVLATQSMVWDGCCATGIGDGGGAGRGLGGWCPVREILVSSTSDLLVPAPEVCLVAQLLSAILGCGRRVEAQDTFEAPNISA